MTRRWMRALRWAAGGLTIATAACGSADSSTSGDFASPTAAGGSADAGTSAAPSPTSPGSNGSAPLPPERQAESTFRAPVATGKYVWIANPTSGRVAYIDVASLDVRTVPAGNGPTYVAAVPGATDAAIVLNVLSDDATLLRAGAAGIESKRFKVAPGANSWAVSPNSRWAIAWTDSKAVAQADRTMGFQDLTIIDLSGATAPAVLGVGYRPVKIGFSADSSQAFAVTQDGVSVVSLVAGPTPVVTKNVTTSDNPAEDPGTRDVSITPDGSLALIRREGIETVTIVRLDTGDRIAVTLPGPVTDLDLSESGDKAVAVVRSKSLVAVLPIPDIVSAPGVFATVTVAGETIGSASLAPDGNTALLYTNAAAVERVTVLSLLPAPTTRVVRLYAPVLAVYPTRDAQHAVVLHDTSTSTPSAAFSLVPVANALPPKIVAAKARIQAVAMSPSSDRAIVTERGDGVAVYGAYLARFPQLSVERFALASPPIAAGIVAGAKRAYVAQEHAEGRITFIDLDSGQTRTLTGFELGARVADGSQP